MLSQFTAFAFVHNYNRKYSTESGSKTALSTKERPDKRPFAAPSRVISHSDAPRFTAAISVCPSCERISINFDSS